MSNNLGEVITNTNPAKLPGPEPLTGQHVKLERLTPDHFSDLYESIGTHADLWKWWPDEPCSMASEFDEYLKKIEGSSSDLGMYAVSLLAGPNAGKAVGLGFTLSEDRLTNRVSELGLFFGHALLGNRAGTEVAYLLISLLFHLNHRRLSWKTNSLNVRSRKAAERYGMLYEGTFRQHQINKGRNRDSSWYSIIDSEWPVCKKAFELWLEDGNFNEQQQQRRKLDEIRKSLT